jgi:hypothetical protein
MHSFENDRIAEKTLPNQIIREYFFFCKEYEDIRFKSWFEAVDCLRKMFEKDHPDFLKIENSAITAMLFYKWLKENLKDKDYSIQDNKYLHSSPIFDAYIKVLERSNVLVEVKYSRDCSEEEEKFRGHLIQFNSLISRLTSISLPIDIFNSNHD